MDTFDSRKNVAGSLDLFVGKNIAFHHWESMDGEFQVTLSNGVIESIGEVISVRSENGLAYDITCRYIDDMEDTFDSRKTLTSSLDLFVGKNIAFRHWKECTKEGMDGAWYITLLGGVIESIGEVISVRSENGLAYDITFHNIEDMG